MTTTERIKEYQSNKDSLITELMSYGKTEQEKFELEMLVTNLILTEDLIISNQNLLVLESQ